MFLLFLCITNKLFCSILQGFASQEGSCGRVQGQHCQNEGQPGQVSHTSSSISCCVKCKGHGKHFVCDHMKRMAYSNAVLLFEVAPQVRSVEKYAE